MKKIGIGNNNGGGGKTTISLCLAGAFAEMDLKVLLVVMNQQGANRHTMMIHFYLKSAHKIGPMNIQDAVFMYNLSFLKISR